MFTSFADENLLLWGRTTIHPEGAKVRQALRVRQRGPVVALVTLLEGGMRVIASQVGYSPCDVLLGKIVSEVSTFSASLLCAPADRSI